MEEAIVSELREQDRNLAMRAKFARTGDSIREARGEWERELYAEDMAEAETTKAVERSAASLKAAAESQSFDVG